jgi:hypothetical protein
MSAFTLPKLALRVDIGMSTFTPLLGAEPTWSIFEYLPSHPR